MQTTKERERLIAAYARETSSPTHTTVRSAVGLAAVIGIALFGAAVDPRSPDLVARLESQKGRLAVEQASVGSRKDVYQLRKVRYERAVSVEPASSLRANSMVNVSADKNAH